MNLQTLRTFVCITDCGKLTEAAEKLNMTQSALSRTVFKLEEEVGSRLFDHQKNRIALNGNGEKFLAAARTILATYDSTVEEIREDNGVFEKTISITISSGGSRLPSLIKGFKDLYPDTLFSIKGNSRVRREPGAHFSLFTSEVELDDPDCILLTREPLFLTTGQSSPLAKLDSVRLADMAEHNFLFADENNDMHQMQLHFCQKAGFAPRLDNIIERQNILMMLLELGEGVTILPRLANSNLAQLAISDVDCHRLIYLKRNSGVYQSRIARTFEDFCRTFFKENC